MNVCEKAALHDTRFVELLVACGAQTTVRTATQQMTVLHVLFLLGKKSAEDTLQTAKLLLDHGLRELINEADSLGNTPLHALIVRYALEEAKYGYGYGGYGDRHEEPQPWNKWDMLHIVRYLIHQVKNLPLRRVVPVANDIFADRVRDHRSTNRVTLHWRASCATYATGSFATSCWTCCCSTAETPTWSVVTDRFRLWSAWCHSSTRILSTILRTR